jgi:mRNA interferase MazF
MAQTTGKKNFPRRGEIFWANLDPTVGSETQKKRPVLIVSNNQANEFSKLVMIAPITRTIKTIYEFEVETIVNGKAAKIMLNQCRAIDQSRLEGKIEAIEHLTMLCVENAIRVVFALPEVGF